MFQTIEETIFPDMLAETSNILEQADDEFSLMMNVFMETSITSVLYEATSANKFTQAIDYIIRYIRDKFNKLIAMFDVRIKPMESLIDKYYKRVKDSPDYKFENLTYRKVYFDVTKDIPPALDFAFVDSAISTIATTRLTGDDVYSFRNKVDSEIPLVRGRVLGIRGPISQDMFDEKLPGIFKKGSESIEVRVTRQDVLDIMDSVRSYNKDRKIVNNHKNMVLDQLTSYRDKISKLFSLSFDGDDSAVTIKKHGQDPTLISIIDANYYREYQTIISSFILDVVRLYTMVFDQKLKTMKEKFDRDYSITKQIAHLF